MEVFSEGTESDKRLIRWRADTASRFEKRGFAAESIAPSEPSIADGAGARPAPRSPPPNRGDAIAARPWRVAILGSNPWARRLLRRFQEQPRARVTHVAGGDPRAIESARARYPEISVEPEPERVLEDPDVDAVVFAGPLPAAPHWIRRALCARKHVLVRQRLAGSSAEARALIEEAKDRGRILATANEWVFLGAVQWVKQQIASGASGGLDAASLALYDPKLLRDGPGALDCVLPPVVAVLNYIAAGPPESVSLRRLERPRAAGAAFRMTLCYGDGASIEVLLNPAPLRALQLAAFGDKRPLLCHHVDPRCLVQPGRAGDGGAGIAGVLDWGAGGDAEIIKRDFSLAYAKMAEHFLESLDLLQESPVNGSRAGLALVRTLEAAERSLADAGARIALAFPLKAEAAARAEAPEREGAFEAAADAQGVCRLESYAAMEARIRRAWEEGRGVWIASRKLGWLSQRLGLEHRTADGVPKVWFGPKRRGWLDRVLTRGLELAVVAACLVAGLPFLLLLALVIKADGGPVFYVSERVGKRGRLLRFLKFRSMKPLGDDSQHRAFMQGIINGRSSQYTDQYGAPIPKNPKDDRVTRIGKLLRKTSIDEVPQFLHVLRGEMALVGPRPPILYEVECYVPWMRSRLDGDVGVTGLWQVNGRNEVSFEEQVLLDLYYLSNRSFLMDLGIILRTPLVMLQGRGAF
jgi:lipopolysaccharide/colanic/teichoic acid biosynthesis glycosyltransferase/predicted dehydrogenase